MAQTYYDILGVPEKATDTEIEAAFKSKARQVHPDKVAPGSPYLRKVAEEAFKDLSEAKTVLLDHAERRKYDAELAYMRGSASSSSAPAAQPPYQASPPPAQAPPAPTPAPPQTHTYSLWRPANTRFGSSVLVVGGLGCLLLLGGIAGSEKTAYFGLALIFLTLGLLCWRHGMRPSTDPKVLGGSVFLFIFAAITFGSLLEPPPVDPTTAKTESRPDSLASAVIPKAPAGKRFTRLTRPLPPQVDSATSTVIPKVPVGKLTPLAPPRVDLPVSAAGATKHRQDTDLHPNLPNRPMENVESIEDRTRTVPQSGVRLSSGESESLSPV